MERDDIAENYQRMLSIIVFAIPIAAFLLVTAFVIGTAVDSEILVVWLKVAAVAGACIGAIVGLGFLANKVRHF